MKAPSPLLGFNNNVRHKGRVFHIQTEDSGIRHPHIITHLFADGGRILKTTKTSYAEHLGNERLTETVRAMMQDQHKAMFIALRDGQFDSLFDDGAGAQSAKTASAPKAVPEAAVAEVPAPPAVIPAPPPSPEPIASAVAPVLLVAAPPQPISMPRPAAHFAPTEPAQRAVVSPVPPSPAAETWGDLPPADPAPVSPPRRRAARPTLDVDPSAIHGVGGAESSIDLDLDALERAAAEAQTPFFQQIQDLPPPPAAVLGNKRGSTGGYSVRSPAPPPPGAPPSGVYEGGTAPRTIHEGGSSRPQGASLFDGGAAPRPSSPAGARPRLPGPAVPAPSPGRYAPSRPASIFATTRPQEGASIFGEDLISEKSLDEVILGYLAEDLDGPAEKK